MHGGDIAKLSKILKVIKSDFSKIKISYALLDSGEALACINDHCLSFDNVKHFVRSLTFLMDAHFSPAALQACEKKKKMKKKNIFFYYLQNCVNYNRNKSRTLEELRQEFNAYYGVKADTGRKKRQAPGTLPPGDANSTESREEIYQE